MKTKMIFKIGFVILIFGVGADKVQQAAEQYKLFYQNPDFNPNNYFINKTL